MSFTVTVTESVRVAHSIDGEPMHDHFLVVKVSCVGDAIPAYPLDKLKRLIATVDRTCLNDLLDTEPRFEALCVYLCRLCKAEGATVSWVSIEVIDKGWHVEHVP